MAAIVDSVCKRKIRVPRRPTRNYVMIAPRGVLLGVMSLLNQCIVCVRGLLQCAVHTRSPNDPTTTDGYVSTQRLSNYANTSAESDVTILSVQFCFSTRDVLRCYSLAMRLISTNQYSLVHIAEHWWKRIQLRYVFYMAGCTEHYYYYFCGWMRAMRWMRAVCPYY